MANRSILKLALPLVLSVTGACAQNQGEKVRDARMEQVDAQAQAKLDAVDEKYKAGGEVVDQQYAAKDQAVDAQNQPGEGAAQDLVSVSKERAEYQNHAQSKLDKLTIRLEAAKEKIDILGAHAPSSLQTSLQTAKTEHDGLKQDVSKLSSVPPDSWGATEESVDQRMSTLDGRISELNKAISDV